MQERITLNRSKNGEWILKTEIKDVQKNKRSISFSGESRREVLDKYDYFITCYFNTEYYDRNLTIDSFVNGIINDAEACELHFSSASIAFYNSSVKNEVGNCFVRDITKLINERYDFSDEELEDEVEYEPAPDPVRDFLEYLEEIYIENYYEIVYFAFLFSKKISN